MTTSATKNPGILRRRAEWHSRDSLGAFGNWPAPPLDRERQNITNCHVCVFKLSNAWGMLKVSIDTGLVMDDRSGCPSEATLREFLVGKLPEAEGLRIAIHVEHCPECERLADQLRERDSAIIAISCGSGFQQTGSLGPTRSQSNHLLPVDLGQADERFDYSLLAPSDRPESLGKLGKYDVIREIGHGGYGVVFEGWDEQLQRKVAIKVLNRELGNSPVARRRFLREARAAAAINHPNVVTIHAVEEHEGIPLLVMELLNGGSLRDWIRTGPDPTVFDVLRIGAQVANGLAAAHSQGVIHRDIKPANILLVDGRERIKITDFGLARVNVENVDLTTREIAVGTPTYMSPEQVSGAVVDSRSDLFSLGCVLYAMFAGHSPFHGRTALEVARKIADEVPPELHQTDPSIPRFVSEIIQRLLEKSPDARFQSAGELADVLNNHLAVLNQTPSDELDAALHAATYSPPRPRKSGYRWRWNIGSVAACLGVLAILWGLGIRIPGGPNAKRSSSVSSRGHAPIARPAREGQLGRVSVAKKESAHCQSLQEALRLVRPGGTIEVLDDGDYNEPIVIDDQQRWRGITITSQYGARLAASSGGPVITIRDTSQVTIRGFRMQLPDHQRGIDVTGDCRGLLIEDLDVKTIDIGSEPRGFLYVHDQAAGTAEEPLVFRRLKLQDRCNAIVIGEQTQISGHPVRWCVLEDCQFLGPNSGGGYQCVLFGGVEDVELRRCLIANAACGFSIAPGANGPRPPNQRLSNVTVQNCTLYNIDLWIRWKTTPSQSEGIMWRDNLVLKAKSIEFDGLESVRSSWFINNWWEVGDHVPPNSGMVAKTFASIPVLSVDPESPEFLKPDLARLAGQLWPNAVIPGIHAQP